MKDVQVAVGWEHQGCWAGATGTGAGAGTDPGAIVLGQYGRAGAQFEAVNVAGGVRGGYSVGFGPGALTNANQSVFVARLYFAVAALPSGTHRIPALAIGNAVAGLLTADAAVFRVLSNGRMEAGFVTAGVWTGAVGAGSATSTEKICPQRWYRLDVRVNVSSASTWTIDWQLNGIAQASVSKAVAAAGIWEIVSVHGHGSDSPAAGANNTSYSDDLAVSVTAADYPLGPGYSVMLFPSSITGGDTFYGVVSTNYVFTDEAGNQVDDPTTMHTYIGAGDIPLEDNVSEAASGDGHLIRMIGGPGGCHILSADPYCGWNRGTLAFHFDNLPALAPGGEPVAVHCYGSGNMSTGALDPVVSSGGVNLNFNVRNAGNSAFFLSQTANVEAITYGTNTGLLRRITPPSGFVGDGWATADVNNITAQWLSVNNNDGNHIGKFWGLASLMLEVHILHTEELHATGCPKEKWGMI